jgi:hypothetical protein
VKVKCEVDNVIVNIKTFKVTSESKHELLEIGYLFWRPLHKVEDTVALPTEDASDREDADEGDPVETAP